jgi:2-polyprenyl-3-methyl-5-hydroxy-6-metoxy-1,4-benzoquinol methylase
MAERGSDHLPGALECGQVISGRDRVSAVSIDLGDDGLGAERTVVGSVVADNDPGALLGKEKGLGPTYSPPAAGHYGHLAGETTSGIEFVYHDPDGKENYEENMNAAERWADALEAWRIPDEILAVAPESPWGFPPSLFAAENAPEGALHRLARADLAGGGTVLDVGCGGGAASVPLVPPATALIGVDSSAGMLDTFAHAAEGKGVDHVEVLGQWPEIADRTPLADVVVCRNVVYNVAPIVTFVTALTGHASKRVVVELTEFHPSVPLRPLWKGFWGLDRPEGPTAEMFTEVLSDLGYQAVVERETRPSTKAVADPGEYVAFVRRRLCLDRSRDPDVADALAALPDQDETSAVVVSWTS